MTDFDWEDVNNTNKYERDLVTLLDVLDRIDLSQFVVDLRVNNKEVYNDLKKLFAKEEHSNYERKQ